MAHDGEEVPMPTLALFPRIKLLLLVTMLLAPMAVAFVSALELTSAL